MYRFVHVLTDLIQPFVICLYCVTSLIMVCIACTFCSKTKKFRNNSDAKRTKQDDSQTNLKYPGTSTSHPFLPPSLYIGAADMVVGETFTLSPVAENVIVRQENNSHRYCELPPVPNGADHRQIALSDVAEPSSRYSILDDPQSESDGLYASVGHPGITCIGRNQIALDITSDISAGTPVAVHRDSIAASSHAPYYSSVASVLSPIEYGEDFDPDALKPHRSDCVQSDQVSNVYARVRPRNIRAVISQLNSHSEPGPITSDNRSRTIGAFPINENPHNTDGCVCPPLPERGYSPSEVESVDRHRRFHPGCSVAPFSATGAQSRNSVQRPAFLYGPFWDERDSVEAHYGKISVRESLASLRARKAFPQLGPVPRTERTGFSVDVPGTISEYERVSGSGSGGTNTSAYDVPQQVVSSLCINSAQSVCPSYSRSNRSYRFSDAYTEIHDSAVADKHVGDVATSPYADCILQPSTSAFAHMRSSDADPSTECLLYDVIPERSFAHLLAEMRAFRHVDSEIDLVHSSVGEHMPTSSPRRFIAGSVHLTSPLIGQDWLRGHDAQALHSPPNIGQSTGPLTPLVERSIEEAHCDTNSSISSVQHIPISRVSSGLHFPALAVDESLSARTCTRDLSSHVLDIPVSEACAYDDVAVS